jgi:L-fuculose-phosphate aldolase
MNSQESILRSEIVGVCRRLDVKDLIAASDGNVSCRLGEDSILITPSGVSKADIEPDDLLVTDLSGNLLKGNGRPSSEIRMHLSVYRVRSEIRAVVHAHPPMATACTLSGFPFNSKILPEVWLLLGRVPTAPYATPSTEEVVRSISAHIEKSKAILLERHGALTLGSNLAEARMRMEKLEHAARILFFASLMEGRKAPPALTDKDIKRLEDAFGGRL